MLSALFCSHGLSGAPRSSSDVESLEGDANAAGILRKPKVPYRAFLYGSIVRSMRNALDADRRTPARVRRESDRHGWICKLGAM